MRTRTGLVAMLVLAGGVGLALLFRTDAPPPDSIEPLETVRRRSYDGPQFLMEVRSAPPEAAQSGRSRRIRARSSDEP